LPRSRAPLLGHLCQLGWLQRNWLAGADVRQQRTVHDQVGTAGSAMKRQ
jgi:hypothetical protein